MNVDAVEVTDFKPTSASSDESFWSLEAVATVREALATSVIYTYVPIEYLKPTSDFPICQTYVDCCLVGCLDWGGKAAAEDFIVNTGKICSSVPFPTLV